MKYIFDFDDVLFNNTKQFKEYIYECLEEVGISRSTAEKYYKSARENPRDLFSLKDFLADLFKLEKDKKQKVNDMYNKIMKECPNFVNTQLFEAVQRIGKENCYIVTKGDEKYQLDKIARSGFASLFHPSHVFVTTNSKREHIERIQAENAGEEMVFLDDKEHTFDELKGLPNLTTIHYKENILEVMKQIENKNPIPEFKKPR